MRGALWAGLLLVSCLSASLAQNRIFSGMVTDTLGHPIPNAQVLLLRPTARVVAFGQTNSAGAFSISTTLTPFVSYSLSAHSMGYETVYQLVMSSGLSQPFIFRLRPQPQELKEVVVRPAILIRNDTTTYAVAQFSDTLSTETIETVLKRLPGVTVAENGEITFKGRKVEKVMLDGDDLLGKRYTLATQNLRANLFSQVQAIDGFMDNPLLKGIEKSDKVSLNLVVKDNQKKLATGNAGLAGSLSGQYEAAVQGLSFAKTVKAIWLGNSNNTGDEWGKETSLDDDAKDASPGSLAKPLYSQSLVNLDPLHPDFLKPVRFVALRTRTAATGLVVNWSKKIRSKTFFFGNGTNSLVSNNFQENFFTLTSPFTIRERTQSQGRNRPVSAHNELFVSLSPAATLKLTYAYDQENQNRFSNLTAGVTVLSSVQQQLASTLRTHHSTATYTRRLTAQMALVMGLFYTQQTVGELFSFPLALAVRGQVPIDSNLATQQNSIARNTTAGSVKWLWNKGDNWQMTIQTGVNRTWQQQQVGGGRQRNKPRETPQQLRSDGSVCKSNLAAHVGKRVGWG